jgi:hypothetical protein
MEQPQALPMPAEWYVGQAVDVAINEEYEARMEAVRLGVWLGPAPSGLPQTRTQVLQRFVNWEWPQ